MRWSPLSSEPTLFDKNANTLAKDISTVCQHQCQAILWCGTSARLAKCLVLTTFANKCLFKFISANDPPIFKNFCQSIHLILDVISTLRLPTTYDNHPTQPNPTHPHSTYNCEDDLSIEDVI